MTSRLESLRSSQHMQAAEHTNTNAVTTNTNRDSRKCPSMGKCVIQQFRPRALEQQRLSHWIKGSFLFLCVVALRWICHSKTRPASLQRARMLKKVSCTFTQWEALWYRDTGLWKYLQSLLNMGFYINFRVGRNNRSNTFACKLLMNWDLMMLFPSWAATM